MESKHTKIEKLSDKLNYLIKIMECPKYYLIEKFQKCITQIDLTVESLLLKRQTSHKHAINNTRELMIKKLDVFEKECIEQCDLKSTQKNLSLLIDHAKRLDENLKNLNDKSVADEEKSNHYLENIEYEIDYETYQLKNLIFAGKNIIFFSKDLCEEHIFNCNNYDDIYDHKLDEENFNFNFFGVLVSLNAYISMSKLINHRKKTLANVQLTGELIKICYAAKQLIENPMIPIIDVTFATLFAQTELDMSNQPFRTIHSNAFDELPRLNGLILKTVNFELFQPDSFKGVVGLKNLKIYKYGDSKRQFTDPLYKKYLRFRTDFKNKNVFVGLTNLNYLDISHNRMKSFDGMFFNGLANLKSIDLSSNHIEKLDDSSFNCLKILEELNLESNSLMCLKNDYFLGLSKLKVLNLENNKIEEIQANTFDSLDQLKSLNLNTNLLEKLDENLFKALKNLKEIDLEDNYFDELAPHCFKGLTSLKVLNLERNKLTSIHYQVFEPLTELSELNLNNNSLEKIDDSFQSLNNLEKLLLNFNQINRINSICFKNQNKLKILDLACNKIKLIDEDSFSKFDAIESIDLRYNQISFIRPNTFNFSSQSIKEINLSSNLLKEDNIELNGIEKQVVILNAELAFVL